VSIKIIEKQLDKEFDCTKEATPGATAETIKKAETFFFNEVYFYSISTILTILTLLTQNKVSVHNTKLYNITFPFFKNYNPVQALYY